MKSDVLTVPTVTLALKTQKSLSKQGIKSRIIKIDTSAYQTGCSYGIEFCSNDFYNVVATMRELGISYKHLTKDAKL